jgi:hypothetical protein
MRLVILHGLPGVGKMTVGQELSAITGYPLFHNHLILDPLITVFGFGTPQFRKLRERIWLDVMLGGVRANLPGLIFTFSPDCTVSPDFMNRLQRGVKRLGGQVFFVEIVCDPTAVARRVADKSRGRYRKLNDPTLYGQLAKRGAFRYPLLPCDLQVDTTRRLPAAVARAISKRLERPSSPISRRDRKKHSLSQLRAIDGNPKNER